MAEPVALRCTLCTPYQWYAQLQTFDSQKELDDHIALHALAPSGKLSASLFDCRFYCCECKDLLHATRLDTCASALAHFKMHKELKMASKTLASLKFTCEIYGSKVCCVCCHALNMKIVETTSGRFRGTKKELFDSASEFVEHFLSVHMATAPRVITYEWPNGDENSPETIRMEQCSFSGTLCRVYEDRNSDFFWKYNADSNVYPVVHEKVQQEIAVKKAIASLLVCYKLSKKDNCLCCLSPVDNHVVNKIVKRMLL